MKKYHKVADSDIYLEISDDKIIKVKNHKGFRISIEIFGFTSWIENIEVELIEITSEEFWSNFNAVKNKIVNFEI